MAIEVYTRDTDTGECSFRVPLAPATQNNASLAITNPNDGDGSIVITVTPDDGNVPYDITLPEPTVDTNTFSVLSGQTITFPNGDTIYVPVGAMYDAATTTLTLDDGTAIDLSLFDTDTDTFATYDAATMTITFASGATFVHPASATFDAASTTLTLSDGTTVDISSFDTDTFATLAGRTITMADGSMITVPNAATYDAVTSILTLDDGTTVNLAAIDTDTFSTFNPATNIITFADGSMFDLDDADTDRYIDPASWNVNNATGVVSYDLVDKDGNVVGNGSIDLSSFVATPHPNVTGSGDITVTGNSTVGWNVAFNENVYVAGANVTITGTGTALDPYVVSAASAPAADGVITGMTINAANVMTITRSVGGPLTIDLSSLSDPADGVVTSGVLNGSNQLILNRTIGGPLTIDLTALTDGPNVADYINNIVLNGNVLEITGQNGAFSGNIDLSSLAGGGADGNITGAVFNATTNVLSITSDVGGPFNVDLSALAGGGGGTNTDVSANTLSIVGGDIRSRVVEGGVNYDGVLSLTDLAAALVSATPGSLGIDGTDSLLTATGGGGGGAPVFDGVGNWTFSSSVPNSGLAVLPAGPTPNGAWHFHIQTAGGTNVIGPAISNTGIIQQSTGQDGGVGWATAGSGFTKSGGSSAGRIDAVWIAGA